MAEDCFSSQVSAERDSATSHRLAGRPYATRVSRIDLQRATLLGPP